MALPDSAKELIRGGALGHLVTLGRDGRPPGLCEYVVVHGRAAVEEGVRFPPMDDPPPGVRLRIEVERVGGIGPWAD
jgi:hypothetical protein